MTVYGRFFTEKSGHMEKTVLVTGTGGFIGFHTAQRLLNDGWTVFGIDNLNAYYDVSLKEDRLKILQAHPKFTFRKMDLADRAAMDQAFAEWKPEYVVNLAAQAGVRYSIDHPHAYVDSNITGFINILENCRHNNVKHLLFASSSSVYGANTKVPFSVEDNVDHPISLYAATKKSNELMAHTYAHLFGIACTGLRFFTVYGPWGRPDMALFKFTKAIYDGKEIEVYNNGDMLRDFTYIDDIVEGVVRLIPVIAAPDKNWSGDKPNPASSSAPYRIYNIGNNSPEKLMDMIAVLEEEIGITAKKKFVPMQPGDVHSTFADTDALNKAVGFKPHTPIRKGIRNFIAWYRDYYKLGNGPASKAS